ncbi:prepilin-type N-terminal cleavage/methylation domain-containing protein [Thalassotalea profundi]|uniref:Prepilin-type N-terminal cleavage/methylation domain-containing protein n=1 Tax=Thalassotalea profundi TaxID=2036687 RepID=A0ABQ3IDQ7_9GAMM|nr:prepilin-type N-terminal cleavage/methylation domain-containing protein [Thalassotalea profundi]GHE80629.1 hypothetical protein GCM10011501_05730 [Thalassotalea profundi]
MLNSPSKIKGMTLIEVLVASIILFIAIGTVSGVQRVLTHYQQLNQLDYVLLLNQQSFFDYIEYSLEQKIYSGEYKIGEYVIAWQSTLEQESAVINSFDPELDANNQYASSSTIKLLSVNYYFMSLPDKTFEIKQVVTENIQATAGF